MKVLYSYIWGQLAGRKPPEPRNPRGNDDSHPAALQPTVVRILVRARARARARWVRIGVGDEVKKILGTGRPRSASSVMVPVRGARRYVLANDIC
jgi:hypothetical protein